jgi:hypothetical protein
MCVCVHMGLHCTYEQHTVRMNIGLHSCNGIQICPEVNTEIILKLRFNIKQLDVPKFNKQNWNLRFWNNSVWTLVRKFILVIRSYILKRPYNTICKNIIKCRKASQNVSIIKLFIKINKTKNTDRSCSPQRGPTVRCAHLASPSPAFLSHNTGSKAVKRLRSCCSVSYIGIHLAQTSCKLSLSWLISQTEPCLTSSWFAAPSTVDNQGADLFIVASSRRCDQVPWYFSANDTCSAIF